MFQWNWPRDMAENHAYDFVKRQEEKELLSKAVDEMKKDESDE